MLAVLTLLVTVIPGSASAAVPNDFICAGVPDAGFVDVAPTSVHKADIDCLKAFGITSGTSPTTYDPYGSVSRWQMALFMTRTVVTDLSGRDQGFIDILGLPADTQIAINQISQLGITTGTTPTSFSPNAAVNRWQMALFLTRLVHSSGLVLPDGSNQGFTDIGGLPAGYQTAINQLAQLGVTTGTSPTTFGPDDLVTREQMASFLIRTAKLLWRLPVSLEDSCVPPITGSAPSPGTVCEANYAYPAGVTFSVRQAWGAELPFADAADEAGFRSAGTRVELWLDGTQVPWAERPISLPGVELRFWETVYPGGLSGTHIFETRWYFEGELIVTYKATIQFS